MADYFVNAYFPESYFAGAYFQGAEQNSGAMSASLSGASDLQALISVTAADTGRNKGDIGADNRKQRKRERRREKYRERLKQYEEQNKPVEPVKEELKPKPRLVSIRAEIAPTVVPVAVIPTVTVDRMAGVMLAMRLADARRREQDEDDIEMLLLMAA